jgi:hypothetical protein
MASQADVRRIALSLPETAEEGGFHFIVAGKGFAWTWMQRVEPKRPRVANREVIAVRVANELEKQALLSLDREVFFIEPHYEGYHVVLVRLPAIDLGLLEKVLTRRLALPRPEEPGGEVPRVDYLRLRTGPRRYFLALSAAAASLAVGTVPPAAWVKLISDSVEPTKTSSIRP